jgi:hypothetical protein
MPWIMQLDGRNLDTVVDINNLTDREIKKLRLILDGLHFDREEIKRLIIQCRAINGSTNSVCDKIVGSLTTGVFEFDLFRQISGWFNTSKKGGDQLGEIIRRLFYGQLFGRFTEQGNNNKPVNNLIREMFLPWLVRVFRHMGD